MPAPNTRERRSKFMDPEQLWDFLGSEEKIVGGHTSIPHDASERARAHFMPSSPAESPARRVARDQESVRKLDWEAATFGRECTGQRPAASPEHERPRCSDGRPAWDDSTATPARRALFAGGTTAGGSSAGLQRRGGAGGIRLFKGIPYTFFAMCLSHIGRTNERVSLVSWLAPKQHRIEQYTPRSTIFSLRSLYTIGIPMGGPSNGWQQ